MFNCDFIFSESVNKEVYSGGNSPVYIYNNCSLTDYTNLCKALENDGYLLYQSNNIDGNLFSAYYSTNSIYIFYSINENKIYISFENQIPNYETKPNISNKAETKLFLFEVDHSLIDCGMCYIVRCDDGSFFIIDSAHYFSVHDDIRIIEFLKNISGEELPRVAGWYFSHAHDDHICKFMDILKFHQNEILIEKLYYNFPNTRHKDSINWDSNLIKILDDFYCTVSKSNIPVVTLHSGMHFAVKNLEFDVLCTHEDIYPNTFTDFNNTSSYILMTACGSKIAFPGDCSNLSNDILLKRYDNALKCDVIQMAHHGHSGLTVDFYKKAMAKCVLFPITKIKFDEEWDKQEANQIVINIANEYYIASDGTVEIPLPYIPNNTKVYPDETFENFIGIEHLWGYTYSNEYKDNLTKNFLKNKK